MKGKQRSYLRGLANGLRAKMQVDKGGLNPEFYSQLEVLSENEELVKINILKNVPVQAWEIQEEILVQTGAESVSQLDNKPVIYRPSSEDPTIILS